MAKQEGTVPRPLRKNEYVLRFATRQAEKGWTDLASLAVNSLQKSSHTGASRRRWPSAIALLSLQVSGLRSIPCGNPFYATNFRFGTLAATAMNAAVATIDWARE